MSIDLLPENFPKLLREKKNDMNGTSLPQIFSYTISEDILMGNYNLSKLYLC